MLLTIGENFLVVTVTQRPGNFTKRYQLLHLVKGPYTMKALFCYQVRGFRFF
ncbi:hypothetical protein SAMN03080615_02767 [Amphritea atlantica]|uniref:Uncharacterized protein n=1 Tax=Amphritea atlantica TaxID=355243 RepID=A0A1H9IYT1_9GAMM|nr:hypothetical protein SAMN03080615_02767 [Amphritea atlantica]